MNDFVKFTVIQILLSLFPALLIMVGVYNWVNGGLFLILFGLGVGIIATAKNIEILLYNLQFGESSIINNKTPKESTNA